MQKLDGVRKGFWGSLHGAYYAVECGRQRDVVWTVNHRLNTQELSCYRSAR